MMKEASNRRELKMMTQREVNRLVALEGQCGYNDVAKAEFRKLSMKLMRELRETLGMFSASVRYNAGGIAVSGDATMHGDIVYVTVNADALCSMGVLYRTCKSKKDYTGGRNNWFSFDRLKATGVKGLAASVAQLLSRNESSQYVGSLDEQLRNESLGGE
jgi:hypothetical protein